jgi:uncharacterized membrane protein YgdD (TMEM256/DUF423 family)
VTLGPALLLLVAALYGAAGVALSAAAAHAAPGTPLASGAQFLLFHAPALVGIALLASAGHAPKAALFAGAAIAVGVALFSGDITVRSFWGQPLFPMAAPSGGMITIAGWLLLAVAAVIAWRA